MARRVFAKHWTLGAVFMTWLACAPSDDDAGGSTTSSPVDPDDGSDDDFIDPASDDGEICDGLDDDGDGSVDEGCPCDEGATQACWAGDASKLGVGVCAAGSQTCVSSGDGEFTTGAWGPCTGAVEPTEELCGDGVDSDCDGSDPGCDGSGGAGGNGDGGAGDGGSGDGGAGGGDSCVPSNEVCGNGIDEDCNGVDDPCDVIDVDIFLLGDCITASCPADHPYPVGCNVLFSPGDDRGCVASTPASSVVYFQAGDECDQGLVGGTLKCSTTMGAPLSAATCPINKPIPIYAATSAGCPDTH